MANPALSGGRLYHSASSDALGQRCERAWWYRYGAGIVEPRFTWADVVAGEMTDAELRRHRASALGVEMHHRIEAWYRGERLDASDLPGQVALSGLHLLPTPEECERGEVEHPVGETPVPGADAADWPADKPRVGATYDGILWAGYRDLVARVSRPEWARLELPASPNRWLLLDHKSSADPARYGKDAATLATDVQAGLYGWWSCHEVGVPRMAARWVYYQTKGRRFSKAVDVVLERDACEEIVADATVRARRLDLLRDEKDAQQNPRACDDYGGCPYHSSAGGPCTATRPIGARVHALLARKKRKDISTMALTKDSKSKFTAAKKGASAEPEETAEAAPPKRGRGRPKKVVEPEPEEPDMPEEVADEMIGTTTWAGNHGPLELTGHALDRLAAIELFQAAEKA